MSMKLNWQLFTEEDGSVNAMARVLDLRSDWLGDDRKLKPKIKEVLQTQVKLLGIEVPEGKNPFFVVEKDPYCGILTHLLYFKDISKKAETAIKAIDGTVAFVAPGFDVHDYVKYALKSQFVDSIEITFSPDGPNSTLVTVQHYTLFAQGGGIGGQPVAPSTEGEATSHTP